MDDQAPATTDSEVFKQYELPDPPGVPVNEEVDTQAALGTPQTKTIISGAASIQSSDYVPGTSGFYLGPTSAEFNFGVAIGQLDIPDTTTTSSFHVDANGNMWLGANTASGYTQGMAYITAAGAAVFKDVTVGGTTLQYVISDSGYATYGDGSDGDATCDGSTAVTGMSRSGSVYTMTRDVYFNALTIDSGVTVKPAGYRIFCKVSLSVSGTIERNGAAGGNGTNGGTGPGTHGAAGAAGASLADGYLKGSVAGVIGVRGGSVYIDTGVGVAGTGGIATSNSIGSNGANGGPGGNGGAGAGGALGSGATATASNVRIIANWHLATLLDVGSSGATVKFDNSAGSGSGGGGAGGTTGAGSAGTGGGSGGSGSSGGIVAIYAKVLTVISGGSITVNGGVGGNGGNGGAGSGGGTDAGGGGGGAGGNGGQLILVYNSYTNGGTVTASGGTGGTGGAAGGAGGTAGSAGDNGTAGNIRQFKLSL